MIREMTVNDLESVLQIESRQFKTPWTRQDFMHELSENPFAHYIVEEMKGQVVAYLGLWFLGNHAQITNLATHPDHVRKGYAQNLVQYALSLAYVQGLMNVNLEVRVSNAPAIALYEKMGFKHEALRKNYYPDTNEDASLMIRILKEKKYENFSD